MVEPGLGLRRAGIGSLAVLASVALYALAFPPASLRALAWLSLVPLLLVIRAVGPRRAFGVGLIWNLAASFVVVDSLAEGLARYLAQPPWVAWSLAALVIIVNSSLHYAVALALYSALARHYRLALPFLCGAAWAAAELARARLLTPIPALVGTPVVITGATQVGWDAFIQLGSVTGQYGLSFLVVSGNAALVELWLAVRERARLRTAVGSACLALAAVVGALLWGQWVLRAQALEQQETPIPIVIVQGNLDPGARWDPESYGRNLDTYLRLTLSSFELQPPRVVFWPEGAMTFPLEDSPHFRNLIARVLSAADAQLVAGGPRMEATEIDVSLAYNSAFLIAPTGDPIAHYDKQYLLPFVEYEPFAGLDLLQRSFGVFRYWILGGETRPLPTRAGDAGVLICNEALLPQLAVERVRDGATFLLSPSNDGWLAAGWTPWPKWGALMLDEAALRAVELRRPMIRASTSGPSGVIDAWGRIRSRTPPGTASILIGGLRPRSDLTLYARVGDLFGALCAMVALGALLRARFLRSDR